MTAILANRRKYIRARRNPAGTPISMSDCVVTLEHDSYEYTGQPIYPVVTVTYDGVPTIVNVDYTVGYQSPEDSKNVGSHTVVVTGAGDYTGQVIKTFQIVSSSQVFVEYDWLESTGTQWINTLSSVSSVSDSIELTAKITRTVGNGWNFAFGRAYWGFGFFETKWSNSNIEATLGHSYDVVFTINNRKASLTADGTTILNEIDWSGSGTLGDLSLFALYDQTSSPSNIRVGGHIIIKINGTKIRELVPGTLNGVPCMKDLVSNTYFYNAGSGTFLYGNET